MDNLGWVQELIAAPDLEALGTILDARLHAYVEHGVPANERLLAERCAFEHEVRRYLGRAQDRGLCLPAAFPSDAEHLGRLRQPEQGGRKRDRPPKRSACL
ncbi:hypothetical protein [Bradyrhizobium elkanii]